jgi:uncharacterized protein YabN with tetrapyrrole methylase and pyrophosphatase domain
MSVDLLNKLVKLEQNASEFGFCWENTDQIMDQITSECNEVTEHLQSAEIDRNGLQEEIGDLLHAVFSLCVFCELDPKETINKSVNKFESRLDMVIHIAKEQGVKSLSGYSFDELMRYWDEAKLRLAAPNR